MYEPNTEHMIARMIPLVAFCASTLFLGCEKARLGEEIEIDHRNSITIKDGHYKLGLEFSELKSDSRCPPNATCFWEGRAIIELTVNEEITYELGVGDLTSGTQTPIPNTVTHDGYIIVLKAVSYGADKNFGDPLKSSIQIEVNE